MIVTGVMELVALGLGVGDGVGVGVGTTCAPFETVKVTVSPFFKWPPPPGLEEMTSPDGTLGSNSEEATATFSPSDVIAVVASV